MDTLQLGIGSSEQSRNMEWDLLGRATPEQSRNMNRDRKLGLLGRFSIPQSINRNRERKLGLWRKCYWIYFLRYGLTFGRVEGPGRESGAQLIPHQERKTRVQVYVTSQCTLHIAGNSTWWTWVCDTSVSDTDCLHCTRWMYTRIVSVTRPNIYTFWEISHKRQSQSS